VADQISSRILRYLRGFKRADHHPVLLPHFRPTPDGLRSIDGNHQSLPANLLSAIKLCDGARSLRTIARETRTRMSALVRLHDEGILIFWPPPTAQSPDRPTEPSPPVFILSPHPDDAALSAFAYLDRARSSNVTVIDVFTRTAWWRLSAHPNVADVTRIREEEEHLVAKLTNVHLEMLDLPEAVLRGYPFREVFTDPVAPRDADVRRHIATRITQFATAHPNAHWLLPLGVGNHVDHVILRDQALNALRHANVDPQRIRFYEDLPYATDLQGNPDFSNLIAGHRLGVAETHEVGDEKLECLRVYWSQLTWSQIVKVGEYGVRIGRRGCAERVWAFAS
jgi:LmbE family N-acetylglucosaminyl deacetylase